MRAAAIASIAACSGLIACAGGEQPGPDPPQGDGVLAGGNGEEGSGGSAGAAGPAGVGARAVPPMPTPGAPLPDGSGQTVFAVRRLFLGETDRGGGESYEAWKQYGFDLDGVDSDADSTGHCRPVTGAKRADIRPDGQGGIDNSFGRNLIPILRPLEMAPSERATREWLDSGELVPLIEIDALGSGADYVGLKARLVTASRSKKPPTEAQWLDGSLSLEAMDGWQRVEGLTPLSIAEASDAYLAGNTLVLRLEQLPFPLFPAPPSPNAVVVTLSQVVLTLELSDDHAAASGGVIGGLWGSLGDDQLEPVYRALEYLSSSFCSSGVPPGVMYDILRATSDSLLSGGQDPSRDCDAISVGLGFEAARAELGEPAVLPQMLPEACQ